MDNFSRKEKIALVVFGVILLAIIIQMIWRLGEFSDPSEKVIAIEEIDIKLSDNLLRLPGIAVDISSRNNKSQTPSKLFDDNPASFWHVALDLVGDPAWVMADFGEGNEKTIRSLAALPRADIPRQFFRKAKFLGSDDGEDWELVIEIIQEETPGRATWRKWSFDNDRAYQYYQFLITDGHEGGKFFSMAELAMFE
jgi:F5/8 type C domain